MPHSEKSLSGKDVKLDHATSELISFISHQIKSPLAAIKGFAGLLYDGHYGELSREAREVVLRIKNSTERILDLAGNLLDLKKIEEGKMTYKLEALEVDGVIKGAIEELKFLAENKGLHLESGLSLVGRKINADKRAMHQVIQNLIENSIKYTDQGFVRVSSTSDNDKVLLSVSDSGRGIKPEHLETIFHKFDRGVHIDSVVEGTGLGLFIVRSIVEAHGGKVWAESEGEGRGSTFFVELPITPNS